MANWYNLHILSNVYQGSEFKAILVRSEVEIPKQFQVKLQPINVTLAYMYSNGLWLSLQVALMNLLTVRRCYNVIKVLIIMLLYVNRGSFMLHPRPRKGFNKLTTKFNVNFNITANVIIACCESELVY